MKNKLASSKEENRKRNKSKPQKQVDLHNLLTKIADIVPTAVHQFRMGSNGEMSMPYSTPAIMDVYGIPPEELQKDFSPAFAMIHTDDRAHILSVIEESKRTMSPFRCEWRVQHPDKGEIWVECYSIPETESDGGVIWSGYFHNITELKRAEQERISNLRFFESMDQVNRAMQGANDLEQMMSDVLDSLLSIFNCDRAWLVYPCDPDAETWRVPMERTRPEYPGGFAGGLDFPMVADVAQTMHLLLDSAEPMSFDPGEKYPVSEDVAREYSVRSFIAMAIYPKTGKPWMFGLHQCSYTRIWSESDKKLFGEIGRRLSDSLTSLLVSRDLRKSEERFRQAFEFAGVGVGMLGLDDQWLQVNRSFCDMLGYSAEEIQAMTCRELTHPEDVSQCQKSEQSLLTDDISYTQYEKRYRHQDGHYLWVRLTTSVVRDDDKTPLYFVVQLEDIDQRKKAEHDITLLDFALNRVNDSVYLFDEKGHFHYVNEEASNKLGYSHDELLSMSVPDIDPEYPMERWSIDWLTLIEEGARTIETVHQTKTGKVFPVEINANYFEFDGRGYNLALVRDITERKHASEALRRSEAELQIALDAGQLGDWKWDLAKNELVWSSRCKAIYGLAPDAEMSPEIFQSLVHPDDRSDVERAMNETLETGKDYETVKRHKMPDGSERWTIGRGKVIYNENSEPVLMAGITMDVTERKLAQQDVALLSFAINHISEAVYMMNENGGFEYVNDKACQTLGYSRDELCEMGVPEIDPDYQNERWREHWGDIKAHGSVTLETIHKTKAGNIYPVEINANYFEYGKRSYNLALGRDITERRRAEEALRRSKADLELALDAGHLGDWKWDIVTNEASWSPRCKALYGLSADAEIDYEKFLSLIHPEDRNRVDMALKKTMKTGKEIELEKRIIWPDGSLHWNALWGRMFRDDDNQPLFMAGVTMDITERKLSEAIQRNTAAALKESDERFRQMAESIHEVFWLTSVDKKQMLYISPAYEMIWGRTCEDLYAEPLQWLEAIHQEDRQRVRDAAISRQATGNYDIEYRVVRPDDTVRYIHDRAFPIHDSSGNVYRIAGVAQDITNRKEQAARIQYLAYHDALTGLPNRTLVMNRLDQAIAQAQRHKQMLAVLFLDLDRFKTINDTLGHLAGDTLLQQAGVCLAQVLREEDTIGRVGGDEFLILLPGLNSPQDAAHVTTKIIESLSAPFKVNGYELHINGSLGISLYPRDAEEAETLVKYADSALYLAKEQGRNTFRFFSPELDARVRARLHMENDLRHAIDNNELFLHYQPQIKQSSGRFIGAEALLRWQHPIHGLVSPAEFIPIAEETGLIISIGEWVLRQACSQACKWKALGTSDFQVSVNLSRRQLEQIDFAGKVAQILEETGCDPNLIELEITESSAMSEPEEAIVKLQALHDMGIQLAIDDFGTGYSSLAYLKRFPFDRLKIDQSFVSGIPEDGDDVAIVQITIMLAHQLRLKIIAEGVETEAQRKFLKAQGCDEMQGYLFGKPQLPEELEKQAQFLCNG